jgi:hypothetical protein
MRRDGKMHYDRENDKLVSIDSDMEIYPINPEAQTFKGAKTIEIDMGDSYVRIPIGKIDELIEGLSMAKKLAV